jgi:hypothetical protein
MLLDLIILIVLHPRSSIWNKKADLHFAKLCLCFLLFLTKFCPSLCGPIKPEIYFLQNSQYLLRFLKQSVWLETWLSNGREGTCPYVTRLSVMEIKFRDASLSFLAFHCIVRLLRVLGY